MNFRYKVIKKRRMNRLSCPKNSMKKEKKTKEKVGERRIRKRKMVKKSMGITILRI